MHGDGHGKRGGWLQMRKKEKNNELRTADMHREYLSFES